MIKRILSRLIDRIDLVAAGVGLAAGIVILLLNLVYSNAYLISMGPLLVAACLLYLLFRRRLSPVWESLKHSRRLCDLAGIVFWLCFGLSIFSLSTESLHRPAVYFILTAVAAAMIAVQILTGHRKGTMYLIIAEILLVSLSVRASAYFVLPTLPGSDTWVHQAYAQLFEAQGYVVAREGLIPPLSEYYLHFPITHIGAIVSKYVTGVDLKVATFFMLSLPLLLSSVFVFLIGRTLANAKVGLLAMLLVSVSDFHIAWSVQPIPTTLGVTFFTIVVYLLLVRKGPGTAGPMALAAVMLVLVLVMTHSLSSFATFCFVAALLVGAYLYRVARRREVDHDWRPVSVTMVVLFASAMLGYWIYVAFMAPDASFFETMVDGVYWQYTVAGYGMYGKPISGAGQIVNFAGFLILLFFGIVGILLWCSREHLSRMRTAFLTALVFTVTVPFATSAFGITILVPARWLVFGYVALSVVAAFGALAIASRMRSHLLRSAFLVCVVFLASFLMITDRASNMDSPVYTPELDQRLVYTEAEMAVGEKAAEVFDGTIVADAQYGWCVMKVAFQRLDDISYGMEAYVEDPELAWSLIERGRAAQENVPPGDGWRTALVLWRDVMSTQGVQAPRWVTVLGQEYKDELASTHHLVYTSGDGSAYLARSEWRVTAQ